MKKLMYQAFAVSLVLFAGCGKKEEKAASSDKTTEAKPAPTAPAPTPAPPAAPDKLMDVAAAPTDVAKECIDAQALYVKIHDCAKLDEKTRASMVKSWNDMVEMSLKKWKQASDDDRKTLTDVCKKLPETAAILVKDC